MVKARTATVVSHYATTNPHEKRISLAAEPWSNTSPLIPFTPYLGGESL